MHVRYKKFDSERRFGVELEVSNTVPKHKIKTAIKTVSKRAVEVLGYRESINNLTWQIKNDASCGPEGFDGPQGYEITSYVGQGIADIRHIAQVADFLASKNIQVNEHCGYHIHADAADLSTTQMGQLLAYWLKLEHVIDAALPSRRRTNDFCSYMCYRGHTVINRSRYYEADELWNCMKPLDMEYYDNRARRVTLNLVNYARYIWLGDKQQRRTIELRWPEGTLNGRDIKNWLRLFLHFIEVNKNTLMPENLNTAKTLEEALSYLGLHERGGVFYILSEGLMETKTWFLERIIKYMSDKDEAYYSSAMRKQHVEEAKKILNQMWSPMRKY